MVWIDLPEEPRPPKRKDVGTKGQLIRLKGNYFPVTIKKKNVKLSHYNVTIADPKRKGLFLFKTKKLEIFEAMKSTHSDVFNNIPIAFDSDKHAFSVRADKALEQQICSSFEVSVPGDNGRKDTFVIQLELVQHSNLQDLLQALQAKSKMPHSIFQLLEVMIGYCPSLKFERVGGNNYFPMYGEFGAPLAIGGGMEGITGFFSSLRPASWKECSLLLNVDVTNTAFYKEQSVLDFLREAHRFSEHDFQHVMDSHQRRAVLKDLKKLKIQVTHSAIPRVYRVRNIGRLGADRQTFALTSPDVDLKEQCTVQKYFFNRYQKKLQYPKLNCLMVGSIQRSSYIPMECCKIVKGQRVQKKLSDNESATLIRAAAKPPHQRLGNLQTIIQKCNFAEDPMMKALEFSISNEPTNVQGRVLPTPVIRANKEIVPHIGVWNLRDHKFFKGESLKCWAVLNYTPRSVSQDGLDNFLMALKKLGKERGMTIEEPVVLKSRNTPEPELDLVEIHRNHPNIQLIAVVLNRNPKDLYARVKKVGDRELQVLTQCVQSTNVLKCSPSTLGNILLKMNAKIGGSNSVLSDASQPSIFKTPVMIMGADVNHPPAGDTSTPSIAAVIGSIDKHASKYAVQVCHQKHRTEMIQDMKSMTKNLLLSFFRATKHKPQRIVMYRDGVSESQFLEVLVHEMKAMRMACMELQKGYEPAITFLVVQKRHHTRLFCQEKDGVGKCKNIPPGTTVDTTITHPSERDFYLCSHQGIQGTSRPSHYHVLWDDSDMTMDQLQALTYAMCHVYSRCSRAVSIPTPSYYAHLAAFRGKVHIQDLCHSDNGSLDGGEGLAPSEDALTHAVKISLEHAIHNRLYYV